MVVELPSLYPHQEKMLMDLRSALRECPRAIVCAPPGTGKTRVAKHILGSFANRPQLDGESGKALFAVHRRGLVDNASESFGESPVLPHGVIMSQRVPNFSESVQVASIDTMNAWFCEDGNYTGDSFDLVIFDETHSHVAKLRSMLKPHDAKRAAHGLNPAFVIGLSATPQHKELSNVFETIIKGPPPHWLIDNGFLSSFRYFRATQGRADKLVKRGDDYTDKSNAEAMEGLSGDLVRDWMKHAQGRATIGFFPRRSHASEAAELLRSHGIRAAYLDGNTKDDERHQMYADLNEGRLDYIANVGVVERGTDIPRVGCVQMCVFVGSIVRWLQMIGRGSRVHPDVPDCLVLDHGDGVAKGWFFEDDVNWTLEWGERPSKNHKAAPTVQCPACGLTYRGGKCKCGYEPSKQERRSQGLLFEGGELVEVSRKEKPKKKPVSNERLMVSAMYIAAHRGLTFGAAWKIARDNARKQGTEFTTPAYVEVAGRRYKMIPFGNDDTHRPVKTVYGFLKGDHSDQANRYKVR
jgi:superfamily II DNA or RNA helicase